MDCYPNWLQTEKGRLGLWVMEGGDADQKTQSTIKDPKAYENWHWSTLLSFRQANSN